MGVSLVWTLEFIMIHIFFYKQATGERVILEGPEQSVYLGDSVYLRCKRTRSVFNFYKDGSVVQSDTNSYLSSRSEYTDWMFDPVSEMGGLYSCEIYGEKRSTTKLLKVRANRRRVELTASNTIIPLGGTVTLSCDVEGTMDTYDWFRRNSHSDPQTKMLNRESSSVTVSAGGVYSCRGHAQYIYTAESNTVSVQETENVSRRVMVAGPVCGVLLILLLLLWRYRKSQDKGRTSCPEPGLGAEAQHNQQHLYTSLQRGDVCVYESISGSNNEDDGESNFYNNVIPHIS